MNSIVIHFSKKWDLWPRYGQADRDRMAIYIRDDLPRPVQLSIITHEIVHLLDDSRMSEHYPWFREIKAAWWQCVPLVIGFLMAIGMSIFSRDRLEFYTKKVKGWIKKK